MKRIITLLSAMALFTLSFATIQPSIVYGLSFDYAAGGHAVSIVYWYENHVTYGESTGDDYPLPTSFSLTGSGTPRPHAPFDGHLNVDAISNASAASANARFGTMGVKAEAVDPSGNVHADVQNANAHVQMGGAFIISGPDATLDLNVLTHLDGIINVTLQGGISNRSILNLQMVAASQDYSSGNYWSSSTGWNIVSRSGVDQGGNPVENPGLYFNNDKISDTGGYVFNNYELMLTLSGVKTNRLFSLDLFLDASIDGPAMGGTLGDKVDFFNTYSMGFTGSNAWFDLPDGYSIRTASEAPNTVPEPTTMLLLGLGLVGLVGVRRRMHK